jgi:voltage-gated potassium channel
MVYPPSGKKDSISIGKSADQESGIIPRMETMRKSLYELLESRVQYLPLGRMTAHLLMLLLLLNVIAAVLETDAEIFSRFGRGLDLFATFSVLVFAAEYILRVWCCVEDPRFASPIRGRIQYMLTPMAIIDLLVILPLILVPFLHREALPYVRFMRIFWILKIGHYSKALKTFVRVFRAKKGEIFISFFIMLVILILGSALIYFAEHRAQPEKFSSVISSMWWGIETMATIGYGDMVPITPLGKAIAGVIALVGIGLFALPAGIFASGFIEEMRRSRGQGKPCVCPRCGHEFVQDPDEK